ncbi:MAG: hypothetical protein PHG08_01055 [Bacilli bacterium]|nr:hypothetical protein [Bacilli bacterium]
MKYTKTQYDKVDVFVTQILDLVDQTENPFLVYYSLFNNSAINLMYHNMPKEFLKKLVDNQEKLFKSLNTETPYTFPLSTTIH